MDRRTLRAIARRTLRRNENDIGELPSIYLTHLKSLLLRHPDENHFEIGLDHSDGSVFCRVCDRSVPAGTGFPEENGVDILGSLANYEEHLLSPSHVRRKHQTSTTASYAGSHGSQETQDILQHFSPASQTDDSYRIPNAPSFPNNRQIIDITSPPVRGGHYQNHPAPITNTYASSNSSRAPISQHDFDADFLLAMQLDKELNGVIEPQSHYMAGASTSQAIPTGWGSQSSSYGGSNYTPQSSYPANAFEEDIRAQLEGLLASARETPDSYVLYRESADVIQARCKYCHFSVALPGSGVFGSRIDEIIECMQAYEDHLRTPHHKRKRNEALMQSQQPIQRPTMQRPAASNSSLKGINFKDYRGSPLQSEASSSSSTPNPPSLPVWGPSSLGKRKIPGAWSDAEDSDAPIYNGYDSQHQEGFISASSIYSANRGQPFALDHHAPFSGPAPTPQVPPPVQGILNGAVQGVRNVINNAIMPVVQTAQGALISRFNELHAANLTGYGQFRGGNANDFDLNYDEEGPVRRIDMGGSDTEKRFRDFMNNALEDFKDAISVTDAQAKLKLDSQDSLLEGMRVRLLPHQIIGVSWMLDQERNEEMLGGILADAMGLGKTVQMIATMAVNRPPRDVEYDFFKRVQADQDKGKGKASEHVRRPTLVLAPASLLQQWYEEFTDKCTPGVFLVHIHHGKDKLKSVSEIEQYDVIITSYQTLTMDFPRVKKDKDNAHGNGGLAEDSSSDSDVPVTQKKSLGPLPKVQWLRVVIDEAQNIRNRSTRISTCVAKLDARYRWCLTGTPVTNTLADIYGYLRFCHFEPWNSWKFFNEQIARVQRKNAERAGRKAQAVLKPHLMRRTKESKIDGKPILQLGPKIIDMIELDFTPEEREMYTRVETSQKQIITKFFKEGTVMKNYAFILVMILRLRQLCCHPGLATQQAQENADDLEAEIARAIKVMGAQKVDEICDRFRIRIEKRMKAEVGLEEAEEDECSICMEPFVENRRVTACTHEFCSDCLNEVLRAAEGAEAGEEGASCPLCRSAIDRKRVFPGGIFEPSKEEVDKIARSLPQAANAEASSSRQQKRLKLEDEDDVAKVEEDVAKQLAEKDMVEPSSKMRRMLETIIQWKKEAPEDKLIVYSQWTSMLNLVQNHLMHCGFNALRYDGKMNRMARVEAVAQFKKVKGPSIMLISLKCGGVGLNLTTANRVINLDLAWNYATEAQAYDRVHRLGQHKDVHIQRLIIRNTIEERIIRLQAKKQGLADAALGEGTAGKIKRMTAREIAQLFDLHV